MARVDCAFVVLHNVITTKSKMNNPPKSMTNAAISSSCPTCEINSSLLISLASNITSSNIVMTESIVRGRTNSVYHFRTDSAATYANRVSGNTRCDMNNIQFEHYLSCALSNDMAKQQWNIDASIEAYVKLLNSEWVIIRIQGVCQRGHLLPELEQ